MTIKFRIKKMPALRARIGGWADDSRITRDLLKNIGFRVERRAKRLAPVDTGRLRASIGTAWRGHRPRLDPGAKAGDAIPMPRKFMVVWVGSNVDYAPAVHENHRSKGKFLKRAVQAVRNDVQAAGRRFNSGR